MMRVGGLLATLLAAYIPFMQRNSKGDRPMNRILIVTSSIQADASVSNRLVRDYEAQLRAAYPGVEIVRRDVGAEPIPHLTGATVAGIRGEPRTPAEQAARALSDQLVAELQAADLVVIASPMYNFGIASTLHSWFDHVLRARVTFRYTEAGPEGLLKGKKAVVIESRAGFYSEGEGKAMDGQERHIANLLGFVGIDDVTFVRAEKLAFGSEAAEASIADAAAQLKGLAGAELKLAA